MDSVQSWQRWGWSVSNHKRCELIRQELWHAAGEVISIDEGTTVDRARLVVNAACERIVTLEEALADARDAFTRLHAHGVVNNSPRAQKMAYDAGQAIRAVLLPAAPEPAGGGA